MFFGYKFQKGFTLIELLVVISIISLLSSVVLTSLNSARSKSRDIRRISDLREVRNAMFLCYDKIGTYNVNGEMLLTSPCYREGFNDSDLAASWTTSCGEFIKTWPTDPSASTPYNYAVHVSADGQRFALLAVLENSKYAQTNAQVTNTLNSLGISGWAQCPEYNYIIGY